MITRLKVKNFKSLDDFEIKDISKFSCFIGLNGSGKTTILQFLDFVKALLQGRIQEWFEKRRWSPSDILTFGSSKRLVEFEIDVRVDPALSEVETWVARFNVQEMRCTYEELYTKDADGQENQILLYSNNQLKLRDYKSRTLPNLKQKGSVLSIFGGEEAVFQVISHLKIFGVLDPSSIAQASQTKKNLKDVEVESNGKGLVRFISDLPLYNQQDLFEKLHQFYSPVEEYKIRRQTFGWKNLLMKELGKYYFDASHLSYGTLRILVFLSQLYSKDICVVFDEIENGINQELIGKLLDKLLDFNNKQVIVTTHSALLLNYLSLQDAQNSVYFLFKDNNGYTHVKNFFEIPSVAKQDDLLGPGEVMGYTDLIELSKELGKEFSSRGNR